MRPVAVFGKGSAFFHCYFHFYFHSCSFFFIIAHCWSFCVRSCSLLFAVVLSCSFHREEIDDAQLWKVQTGSAEKVAGGRSTGDSEVWRQQLQVHCELGYDDKEGDSESQAQTMQSYRECGDRMTSVLQAKDSVVSAIGAEGSQMSCFRADKSIARRLLSTCLYREKSTVQRDFHNLRTRRVPLLQKPFAPTDENGAVLSCERW